MSALTLRGVQFDLVAPLRLDTAHDLTVSGCRVQVHPRERVVQVDDSYRGAALSLARRIARLPGLTDAQRHPFTLSTALISDPGCTAATLQPIFEQLVASFYALGACGCTTSH